MMVGTRARGRRLFTIPLTSDTHDEVADLVFAGVRADTEEKRWIGLMRRRPDGRREGAWTREPRPPIRVRDESPFQAPSALDGAGGIKTTVDIPRSLGSQPE